jgi:hypothetical protein
VNLRVDFEMQNCTQEILFGFDEIKQARYITLEEQKEFVDFLEKLGIPSYDLDWCASEYKKYKCSSGSEHSTKTTYRMCGNRGMCPRCSMAYATTKSNERYQYIKQNIADRVDFDLKMNQIVLTLPKELHELDKKVFSKMIKQFMIEFNIHAYGYVIQDRHSSDPLADTYHHAHILSLNFKAVNERIERCDYFFDTNKMRSVWKTIIEKNTDISIEGNVNVNTEYCSVNKEKGRCIHLLKYVYRYSLEDLFKVQVRNHSINYLEKSHSNVIRDRVLSLIDEKKPQVTWCGLLASTKQKQLRKMISDIGYHWKTLKEIKIELMIRANTCPDCCMPFSENPFETGKYQGDNEPEYPT